MLIGRLGASIYLCAREVWYPTSKYSGAQDLESRDSTCSRIVVEGSFPLFSQIIENRANTASSGKLGHKSTDLEIRTVDS